MSHTPTDEQQHIIDTAATGEDLVIEAGAGCGKSASLCMVGQSERWRPGMLLAFGREVAAQAKSSFPPNVNCSTGHSLAFHAVVPGNYDEKIDSQMVTAKDLAEHLGIRKWFKVAGQGRKDISSWRIAALARDTVARYCRSGDEQIKAHHVPFMQGVANQDELKATVVPYAAQLWAEVVELGGGLPFRAIGGRGDDAYMKIWALTHPRLLTEYVMVDECFPAGTIVDTSDGPVPIEQIAEHPERDWAVMASTDGGKTLTWSNVTSAYETPRRNRLVCIYHEHGTLVCTANHPVWVIRGGSDGESSGAWTSAGLVREGDSVSCMQQVDEEGEPYLFFGMRSEADGARALVGVRAGSPREDLQTYEGGANRDPESDERSSGSLEGVSDTARDRAQAIGARWERYRPDRVRADAVRGADKDLEHAAMEPRSCRRVWGRAPEGRVADPLQDRHRIAGDDDRDRGGRLLSLGSVSARAGSPQGRVPIQSRVARVSLLEPSDSREGDGDRPDGDVVYTLSVEAGSYVADGVLVKNCQDTNGVLAGVLREQDHLQRIFVGDSRQRLFDWRGSVDIMSEFSEGAKVCYLTQSFRFGDEVAEEANRWLSYLDAPLRLRGLPSIDSELRLVERPDAILCRTNAHVIEQAMLAQENSIPVAVVGGTDEISKLADAVQKLQQGERTSHPELSVFKTWQDVLTYVQDERPGGTFGTMMRLIENYGTRKVMEVAARCVPADQAERVVATVHKVKGLEWPSVAVDGGVMPADETDPSESSFMVCYVAVTRAQLALDATAIEHFHRYRALAAGQARRDSVV